jgi:signal transduction histidine kinase
VLLASVALVVALRTADLTYTGWLWPATAAFATAVLYGRLWWAVGTGVVTLAFGATWEWTVQGGGGPVTLAADAVWFVLVTLGASAYRDHRRSRVADEARRESEERLRIAREVHDVVAHTLTVVGVQLRVAAESLTDAPDEARAAIETAQAVRRSALEDLRGLVDVLRSPASLDLPRIVSAVAGPDLAVSLASSGAARPLPAPVALTLTRVVQEALTNVVRHASATSARIEVHYGASEVSVTVTDDGRGGAPTGGHGLAGLAERVAALGGSFAAGPGPSSGFTVQASVPLA